MAVCSHGKTASVATKLTHIEPPIRLDECPDRGRDGATKPSGWGRHLCEQGSSEQGRQVLAKRRLWRASLAMGEHPVQVDHECQVEQAGAK